MRFKFVTFDLNGTIFKPARPIGEIYSKYARKHGIEKNPQVLSQNFKNSMVKMSSLYPNFGCGSIGWESWWKKVVASTFEPIDGTAFDRISEELLKKFATKEPWELYPNVEPLLQDLKLAEVQIGAITNSDPRVSSILEDFGLIDCFKFVLTSYDINEMKPDKKVFLHAEKLFGNFNRNEAIHIGDSISKDFEGATNAGWNAILMSNKDSVPDKYKKFVCQDVNEIRNYLKL